MIRVEVSCSPVFSCASGEQGGEEVGDIPILESLSLLWFSELGVLRSCSTKTENDKVVGYLTAANAPAAFPTFIINRYGSQGMEEVNWVSEDKHQDQNTTGFSLTAPRMAWSFPFSVLVLLFAVFLNIYSSEST